MTLVKLKSDQDLTLSMRNVDVTKQLEPCLPHLFRSSVFTSASTSASDQNASFQRDYYDQILTILLAHLHTRNDPDLELMGAVQLLMEVCETEPNCDKRLVSGLYDEIRHRMEA